MFRKIGSGCRQMDAENSSDSCSKTASSLVKGTVLGSQGTYHLRISYSCLSFLHMWPSLAKQTLQRIINLAIYLVDPDAIRKQHPAPGKQHPAPGACFFFRPGQLEANPLGRTPWRESQIMYIPCNCGPTNSCKWAYIDNWHMILVIGAILPLSSISRCRFGHNCDH